MESLPIAETFHSIQGEGYWTGTAMHFVRLAGCPVGAKATQEAATALGDTHAVIPTLESGLRGSFCKTWDGRRFVCDTDFSCHTYKSVDELIGETWEEHICLTGGEPLIHQKNLIQQGFFAEAFKKRIQIHIETSGTIMLVDPLQYDPRIWVTVAPKFGFLPDMVQRYANEVKLLVDENFDETKFTVMPGTQVPIYICPINGEKLVNPDNVILCRRLQRKHPNWKISAQWHKLLEMR